MAILRKKKAFFLKILLYGLFNFFNIKMSPPSEDWTYFLEVYGRVIINSFEVIEKCTY